MTRSEYFYWKEGEIEDLLNPHLPDMMEQGFLSGAFQAWSSRDANGKTLLLYSLYISFLLR